MLAFFVGTTAHGYHYDETLTNDEHLDFLVSLSVIVLHHFLTSAAYPRAINGNLRYSASSPFFILPTYLKAFNVGFHLPK